MPEEYHVTIRLTPEIYTQLEARGSQGQPLAALVRQALVDYLTRQPEAPASAEELALAAAAVAARLDGLQAQVEALATRVESLAAVRQPAAATPRQQRRAPSGHGLPPETLQAIADERTHCVGLSVREFAQ